MLILANRLDGGLDDSLSPHSTVVRPHMSDVSPQIMSSPYYSLPVRFDHIFSKTSLGIVARGRKWSPKDITESVIKPYSQRVLDEDII